MSQKPSTHLQLGLEEWEKCVQEVCLSYGNTDLFRKGDVRTFLKMHTANQALVSVLPEVYSINKILLDVS